MEKYRDFSHLPFPAFPSLLFTPSLVAHQDVDLSPSHLSSFLVSIFARAPSRSLSWLTHIFTFFVFNYWVRHLSTFSSLLVFFPVALSQRL